MNAKLSSLFLMLLIAITAVAQQTPQQPVCDVTCEPALDSSTYLSTGYALRTQLSQARGRASAVAPRAMLAQGTIENVGSESYSYEIPVLSLPGRAGLDLRLVLYYDSGLWSTNSQYASFNADRDYPSYGFKLGFGYLETPGLTGPGMILTERDGTKRKLIYNSTTAMWNTSDGSFIDYNPTTKILRYRDGTRVLYQNLPSPNGRLLRPIRITDRNGNYISMAYTGTTLGDLQKIDYVLDTLGRRVNFTYDANGRLASLVQVTSQGDRVRATFGWGTIALTYNFASPIFVSDTPANSQSLNVLRYVQFPDNTGYVFEYGDWGLVRTIKRTAAPSSGGTPLTAPVRSSVTYNYPNTSTPLSDSPTYTQQTVQYYTKNVSGTESLVTETWGHSVTKTNGKVTSSTVTDPAGTKTITNLYTSGTYAGMMSSTELKSSSNTLLRAFTYEWLTNAGGAQLRAVATTLGDTGQNSLVYNNIDQYGNVTESNEYDYDGQLKRRTQTTYGTTNLINRHILNLPTRIMVTAGGTQVVSRTDFNYDTVTPTAQSGAEITTTVSGTPAI